MLSVAMLSVAMVSIAMVSIAMVSIALVSIVAPLVRLVRGGPRARLDVVEGDSSLQGYV